MISLVLSGRGWGRKYAESGQIELEMIHFFKIFYVFLHLFLDIYLEKNNILSQTSSIEPFCDLFGAIGGKGDGGQKYAESGQIELQMIHVFTFFFTFFPGHKSGGN